ncbi:MAG: thioredoxin family protein [Chitinophagaceae bacterium]
MKKHLVLIATIFIAFTSCQKKVKEPSLSDYKVSIIHEDWNAALLKATSNQKNVCVIFHASWCNICNTFLSTVLTDANVESEINSQLIISLIDGDKDYGKPYFNEYGGQSFPTFIIINNQGVELAKRSGGMSKTEFLTWIKPYYQ